MTTAWYARVAGFARHQGISSLLVLSVGINVALAQELSSRSARKAPSRLAIGAVVGPALSAKTLDGRAVRIAFADAPATVLYYFSPSCGWCERNWNNVTSLAARRSSQYRFVGISATADAQPTLERHGVGFEVVTGLDAQSLAALRLGGTPQTVVVSKTGQVLKAWDGAYAGTQAKDVEDFFGLTLPGLAAPAKK